MTSYHKAIATTVDAENDRSLAITSIALKRFALRHGHYPETLQELVPEFVVTLLRDWMVNQPLRYRRNSDQTFTLYSVGDDGQDDGGVPEKDYLLPETVPWAVE